MTRSTVTALAAALAATLVQGLPAQAQQACPTAADLATGIRFIGPGGAQEVFRQVEPGLVQSDYRDAQYTNRVRTAGGIYMSALVDTDAGETIEQATTTYRYVQDTLPEPQPGMDISVVVDVTEGGATRIETHRYVAGDSQIRTYGDCSYTVIPLELRYEGSAEVTDLINYLPELGVSYLAGYSDAAGRTTWGYTQITAVE